MMKNRYTYITLCLTVSLNAITVANAQEDALKKKNLNREMTLEREYAPTVQDANKVNTLPVIKEPIVKKIPIDYAGYVIPYDPEKEINLLPSGKVMTDVKYNKRRGYLNFGIGTYMNLNGDLGYHILSSDKDKLNIFLSHRSTNGKVKYLQNDEKVKAKLNDNLGGINFSHVFDKLALNMGLRYGYSAFNYYGLPIEDIATEQDDPLYETPADRSTKQVDQTIKVRLGVESNDGAPVGYLLDLNYTNFSHKYGISPLAEGSTEHTVSMDFGLSSGFGGNQRIGLDGNVRYLGYDLPPEIERPESSMKYISFFDDFAAITLSPYYKVEGDNWNIKLGANVMFQTHWNKKIMVSPNIAADVEVADKTVLYLKANGKLQSNSMYEVSQINRYVNPTKAITPSRNWLDAIIGIKSGVAPGFWFDVFAGYKITSDNFFFQPSNEYLENDFGNYSDVFEGIDTKQLFIGANLKYSFQQLLDINLKGVYNNWDAEFGSGWDGASGKTDVLGMPELEFNAGITIRPIEKLSVALDYYLATGRETSLFEIGPVKMKNINELNLTGTYAINDTFGAYVKLNNVLFQKYEVLYGYPQQGFSAMIGININF